jgi:hypothetical protein
MTFGNTIKKRTYGKGSGRTCAVLGYGRVQGGLTQPTRPNEAYGATMPRRFRWRGCFFGNLGRIHFFGNFIPARGRNGGVVPLLLGCRSKGVFTGGFGIQVGGATRSGRSVVRSTLSA